MSSVQTLREFISERLTAAAEEIFTEFEKTIVQYEEVIDRQRRLLEISWKPHIHPLTAELPQQHVWKEDETPTDQQLCNQESNSSLDQEEPEPLQKEPESVEMKEEQEIDAFLVTPACNERYLWELGPNRKQLLSQNSAEVENQVQEGSRAGDPGSCRDEELRLNKRSPQARGLSDDVDQPKPLGEQKKPFLCLTCGKRFSVKHNLFVHMRTHTGEKPFSCQTCGKSFNYKSVLITHMRTHTGEKPFSCQTCGKSFNKKNYLIRHMRTHSGEKPFSCQSCGKSYSDGQSFKSHMTSHTGEKPFSCEICGKSYSEKKSLKYHMRSHTGERPFSCQTCGKGFSQKFDLIRHMKTHTGEKPFSCQTCGKSFNQKFDLIRHMRTHTGEKPFSCQTCGKTYSDRKSFKNHMTTHTD